MRVPSDFRSRRVPFLSCGALLALGALSLIASGCFMTRSQSEWSGPARTAGRCAILPVFPEQVRVMVDAPESENPCEISAGGTNLKSMEDVIRSINEVLDSIAAGTESPFQGPGEMEGILKRSPQCANLQVYLQDPGPLGETWKVEGLAAICRQLGLQRLVIVSLTLRFRPNINLVRPDPLHHHWDGKVEVEATMLDISTGKGVAKGRGEASFFGDIGAIVIGGPGAAIFIPYAFGKTFGRGVDEAARRALENLFEAL
ncbi:MAG: hypothetical protein MIO92_13255 [Methanosarcinaceae archaeon]|nr:hypothetical protein [Methanosarcinaceae archaeon]